MPTDLARSLPALTVTRRPLATACWAALIAVALVGPSAAHPGHDHSASDTEASASPAVAVPSMGAITGSGELRFRYNAELSVLPSEIAAGIKRAHGGFAQGPGGELYFGLEGTGIVRVSADLRTKTLLKPTEAIVDGGLHNTTYLDRDGGRLVLPDNARACVHVVDLEGAEVLTLPKPTGDVHPHYTDPATPHAPTDAAIGPNGLAYVTDGYGSSKFVLEADLDSGEYTRRVFGEAVGAAARTPGKFSTAHGITWNGGEEVFAVADRERQWVQRFAADGEFVSGVETGGNPCDAEYVEWLGESLMVVGCLRGPDNTSGVVQLVRGDEVVSSLRPKADLGLEEFEHIHNAIGVVVDGKLYVLCYGWNPGCYAVLEHITE